MLDWTRALRISAISGAVALSVSASAQTADPPLLPFFKTFCVDTRGDEAAIKKAVEAAGGEVTIFPDTGLPLRWEKATDGKKITLFAGDLYFRGPKIERHITECSVGEYSHDTADGDAIRDWIGVPPSKTSASAFRMDYDYTYQEAAGLRSAVPFARFYDTDDVWWIEVEYGGDGTTSVQMHLNRRYLRGTIPGQAAPTSN